MGQVLGGQADFREDAALAPAPNANPSAAEAAVRAGVAAKSKARRAGAALHRGGSCRRWTRAETSYKGMLRVLVQERAEEEKRQRWRADLFGAVFEAVALAGRRV